MTKIQIGCFIDQFSHLKSWMKLRIWELFFSHSTRALTFAFMEKNRNNFKRKDFVFFQKNCILSFGFQEREENIFLLLLSRKEENIFFTFIFTDLERGEKAYIFLWFPGTENSYQEREFFFFNSGSFWVVLKLSETAPIISPIYWVGLGWINPLGHPNPSPTTITFFIFFNSLMIVQFYLMSHEWPNELFKWELGKILCLLNNRHLCFLFLW